MLLQWDQQNFCIDSGNLLCLLQGNSMFVYLAHLAHPLHVISLHHHIAYYAPAVSHTLTSLFLCCRLQATASITRICVKTARQCA
jgi:hypothetical protein